MPKAFDFLDAPVLNVTGKDVPMPYAANLEKLALPSVKEVVEAVKAVSYADSVRGCRPITGVAFRMPSRKATSDLRRSRGGSARHLVARDHRRRAVDASAAVAAARARPCAAGCRAGTRSRRAEAGPAAGCSSTSRSFTWRAVVVPDIAGWRRERLAGLPDTATSTLHPTGFAKFCRRRPSGAIGPSRCVSTPRPACRTSG